jgi:enoyl-CoA hydratase/carnithine racemase
MTGPPPLRDALLTLEERVATLTLNRDDVRNALTGTALIDDICTAIDWVDRSADVSVLILTGAGRAFSAGGNVKEMRDRAGAFAGTAAEIAERYRRGIQRIPRALHGADVPVIAAVNGPAIGAGCDLACMADIRIASTEANFGETFVTLGIIPGDGGAWFLQRLIGPQRAAELTFTGRIVGAAEAREIGLVLEVVAAEALPVRARELARAIARQPPQALRYAKRLTRLARRLDLADFLDLCAVIQGVCHESEDHAEAVAAFLEKRLPSFTGR